ncbi:MAG: multidrug efflux system outer membrane protein [Cryomorphaceae bacterium]|jgi:multidrug efflux system outer membrane protein
MLCKLPINKTVPKAAALILAVTFIVSGCIVGPNHSKPDTKIPAYWTGKSSRGSLDSRALNSWWMALDDRKLTSLINRAVDGNLSLRAASSRLLEARARRGVAGSARFPTINATGNMTRSEFSRNARTPFPKGTVYSGGFDAGWELDLFGGIQRQVEAADANIGARIADYGDVRVTLLAEVALNYVEVRAYQGRLDVAEANRDAQVKTLELVQANVRAGEVSRLDLEQARANLESTRSQIPTLQIGASRARHRLAVLLGEPPASLDRELSKSRPIPVAPSNIAVGIPAEVLRRRPDVKRAERELAAQCARVGIATAELYPKLKLIGTVGLESLAANDFLTSSSRVFNVGPSVQWNIFSAGRVRQNIAIQSQKQEQALVAYEAAILAALREVEDALVSYGKEMFRRDSLIKAESATTRLVGIGRDQYRAGETSFLTVLDAERSLLRAQDLLTQSNAQVTTNVIMLYKALGGGWN